MDHGKQYVKGCYKTVDIYKQKIEVKDSGDEYTVDWVQEIYDSMPKYNKEDFNWSKNNCQHFALQLLSQIQNDMKLKGGIQFEHSYINLNKKDIPEEDLQKFKNQENLKEVEIMKDCIVVDI